MDLNSVLEQAASWAREAGALQRSRYRGEFSVDRKSSAVDLVTDVDRESEALLLTRIREAYPGHGILGEETGLHEQDSEYCWVVDPLDGTTNYAQGLPIFAVSIALQRKGESVLGVVYAPMLDQVFTAVTGGGARLNGEPLKVSAKERLSECVIATGFPYDLASQKDNNGNYFAHMVPRTRGLRRMGAAAYDLAMVAAGALDGYWEMNLSPWDVAAGTLLVTEAGGVVQPWKGKRGISVVAGNRILVGALQKELAYVDLHEITALGT